MSLDTIEANVQTYIGEVCDASKGLAWISVNTRNGVSTCTLREGGADTALTISIPDSTTGVFENVVDTNSFSLGDLAGWAIVLGGSSGSFTVRHLSCVTYASSQAAAGTPADVSVLCANVTNNSAPGTFYSELVSCRTFDGTESFAQRTFSLAGTLQRLSVYVSSNAASAASTFGTRKNASAGTLTVSIPKTTTGRFTDVTHTDTIAIGDEANYQIVQGGMSGQVIVLSSSVTFVTAGIGGVVCSGAAGVALAQGTTNYLVLSGGLYASNSISTTESQVRHKVRGQMMFSDLFVNVTSNSLNVITTLTFWKNGAAGSIAMSVAAGTTGLFTEAERDTAVGGDLICTRIAIPAGSGTIQCRTVDYHVLEFPIPPSVTYLRRAA